MGPNFSDFLMEILSANKDSLQLLKSLLGYANTDLINALKVDFLADIMALQIENGTVVCKTKCPIFAIFQEGRGNHVYFSPFWQNQTFRAQSPKVLTTSLSDRDVDCMYSFLATPI